MDGITKSASVDAWARARERYLEDLTDEEKVVYEKGSKATLEAIFYDASAAEKAHRLSSRGRKVTAKILLPLIEAVEQYEKALDVYANASPSILCPLWGSIRVVLHVRIYYSPEN